MASRELAILDLPLKADGAAAFRGALIKTNVQTASISIISESIRGLVDRSCEVKRLRPRGSPGLQPVGARVSDATGQEG